MVQPRAFDANAARLLRRATVVYSVDDIRRNITERLADGAPCVLEMGANIPIETMTLPGGLRSFSIDGAGRWSFIVRGDQSSVFRVLGRDSDNGYSTTFANLSIKMKSGSTATALFRVEQMPLSAYTEKYTALNMRNVNVEGLDGTAYTIGSIFGLASVAGFRFGIINIDGMTIRGATYMFEPADTQALWFNSSVKNVAIGANSDAFASTIGGSIGGCAFGDCVFQGISGKYVVDTGLLSDNVFWSVLRSSASPCTFVTNNAGAANQQTLLRVDGFTRNLSIGDVDLDAIDAAGDATLSTAAPTLSPGASTFLRVIHTAGASGVVTVAAPINGTPTARGRPLVLRFVTVAGTAVYTDGSGNLQLSANFTPTSNDTLTIAWDSTTSLWYEIARSVN